MSSDILESRLVTRRRLVTPEIAQQMLDKKPEHQRAISPALVEKYAADMKAGRWAENAETIKLDVDGLLLDGQHRLSAIVASRKSQFLLIVSGVDASSFSTIDVGRKRTPGDMFSIDGWTSANGAAALARLLYSIEQSHRSGILRYYAPAHSELLAWANKHQKEIENALGLYGEVNRTIKPCTGAVAAMAYLQRFSEYAEGFAAKVLRGEGLERGTPAIVLRNYLLRKNPSTVYENVDRAASVFLMFGAHLRGDSSGRMIGVQRSDDGKSVAMPVVYIDKSSAANHDGKTLAAATARKSRARHRANPIRKKESKG